jgi:AraC-type transcriptional regulator
LQPAGRLVSPNGKGGAQGRQHIWPDHCRLLAVERLHGGTCDESGNLGLTVTAASASAARASASVSNSRTIALSAVGTSVHGRIDIPLTRSKIMTVRSAAVSFGPSDPARVVRAFVDALERLGYDMDPLLAEAGLSRADFDRDPDARIPCSVMVPLYQRAVQQRPITNAGMKIAAATPIGTFPRLDYVIVTCETVGEGLRHLARYFRLVDALHDVHLHDGEDPVRVVFESRDGRRGPFGYEFGIALTLLHLREETGECFRASYASFGHTPDDTAEAERLLECPVHVRAGWNGFALPRSSWELPMRRRDPILSKLLQRQADAAIARLPPTDGVVYEVSGKRRMRFARTRFSPPDPRRNPRTVPAHPGSVRSPPP